MNIAKFHDWMSQEIKRKTGTNSLCITMHLMSMHENSGKKALFLVRKGTLSKPVEIKLKNGATIMFSTIEHEQKKARPKTVFIDEFPLK